MTDDLEIRLRSWQEDDLSLLHRLVGDPAMMTHLGGPETQEKIESRHRRYLAADDSSTERVFAVIVDPEAKPAGWIGYWASDASGAAAWETGWAVVPEWQGRGVATRGMQLALERATDERRFRNIYAYPAVTNGPSNRLAARLGFELLGTDDVEYPKGHWMTCNIWRRALW
jgi:RimJ/RimL family protein N-acetyltransferase